MTGKRDRKQTKKLSKNNLKMLWHVELANMLKKQLKQFSDR